MATSRPNAGLGDFRSLFQVGSFVGMSDAELLERYVTGCEGIAEVAFAALVERHSMAVEVLVCCGRPVRVTGSSLWTESCADPGDSPENSVPSSTAAVYTEEP